MDSPHSFSWGKGDRLLRRSEFSHVQRRGRRVHGRYFLMISVRNQSDSSRFGITVSRRVGNSVERNRLKRRVREILRHRKCIYVGADIVFIAKSGAPDALFADLSSEIEILLLKGSQR